MKLPRMWACLICSCVATISREEAIREESEPSCHVELTENCTTLQRKITAGTNGSVRRFFPLLHLALCFFEISSLAISVIPYWNSFSLGVLQCRGPLVPLVLSDAGITEVDALAFVHWATWTRTAHTHTCTVWPAEVCTCRLTALPVCKWVGLQLSLIPATRTDQGLSELVWEFSFVWRRSISRDM